jgi:hypothetical protein
MAQPLLLIDTPHGMMEPTITKSARVESDPESQSTFGKADFRGDLVRTTGAKALAAASVCCLGLSSPLAGAATASEPIVLPHSSAEDLYARGSKHLVQESRQVPEPRNVALLGVALLIIGTLATRRRQPSRQAGERSKGGPDTHPGIKRQDPR